MCVCELLDWAQYYPHVLYGATESVCDTSIMNWFLAEPKVSEFDVSFKREKKHTEVRLRLKK